MAVSEWTADTALAVLLKDLKATHLKASSSTSRCPSTQQLAAKVHVQSQTLGRVLARLETGGYVTRTRNPADRRQFHVHLTSAGRAALAASRQAEVDAFPSTLDADDWHIFHEQLDRFIHALRLPSRPSSAAAIEHDGAREPGQEVSDEFSRQRRSGPDKS